MNNFSSKLKSPLTYLYLGLVISIIGILGSLYYSEVMKLQPCVLCWYQRAMMYPIAIIFLIGIITLDFKSALYVLVLSGIGGAIALYQVLLQLAILPDSIAPCVYGISCAVSQFNLFGFFTIPMQALIAFLVIGILSFLTLKFSKN